MPKVGDMVSVTWEDHYHHNVPGWNDVEQMDTDPYYITTVGYIVKQDRHRIALAPTLKGDQFCGGYSVKIKKCITNIKVIKRAA